MFMAFQAKKVKIIVSRKSQYKDVYRRTIEKLQRARILRLKCSLKVHKAHLKLVSQISGLQFLDFKKRQYFSYFGISLTPIISKC